MLEASICECQEAMSSIKWKEIEQQASTSLERPEQNHKRSKPYRNSKPSALKQLINLTKGTIFLLVKGFSRMDLFDLLSQPIMLGSQPTMQYSLRDIWLYLTFVVRLMHIEIRFFILWDPNGLSTWKRCQILHWDKTIFPLSQQEIKVSIFNMSPRKS